ncbi:MAG TPA: DUF222 domain-containing protein [Acidothermaceae bacterium]
MARELADVAAMAPSVELASLLAGVTPDLVDDDNDLLEVIAGWDRLASWVTAHQLVAVAEFARRPWSTGVGPDTAVARAKRAPVGGVGRDFPDDEIAARLAITSGSAGFKLSLAVTLASPLTATADALRAGVIDVQKARAIADGCRHLDPATAVEVETTVLARAAGQTAATVRKAVRRAAIAADPVAAAARCASMKDERGVWLIPQDDGVTELRALLSAPDALSVYQVLTAAGAAAKTVGGEARTIDQLRADYLVAPFMAAIASGELAGAVPARLASHHGQRGQLQLTVPASVVMGVSNAPGELVGYGPITAEVARVLAGDCTWRRIVTNPIDGTFLDADSKTYRPPAALVRHVEGRDQTCVFLGCDRPAAKCHLDHTTRFPAGETRHDNLGAMCRRHHLLKHALDGAFANLKQPTPGTFEWTLPTGHVYARQRPPIAPSAEAETGIDPPAILRKAADPTGDDPPF